MHNLPVFNPTFCCCSLVTKSCLILLQPHGMGSPPGSSTTEPAEKPTVQHLVIVVWKKEKVLVAQVCPILCDPRACVPPGSFVHGDSPGKNTGVGNHSLLQGMFSILGSNPGGLHCRLIFYCLQFSWVFTGKPKWKGLIISYINSKTVGTVTLQAPWPQFCSQLWLQSLFL